jgi:hypothetical protein
MSPPWIAAGLSIRLTNQASDDAGRQGVLSRERTNVSEESVPQAHVRTPETDEVLRRIGRNVVIFQQVEYLLKHLTSHAAVHAPASRLSTRMDEQRAAVHKKTMGELAGKLVSGVLQPQPEHQSPDEIDEPWFGFRFSVGADAEFVDRHDQEMRALVNARNELIHHFLPRWQASVGGDTQNALTYLDAQRAAAVQMKERLEAWSRSLEAGRKQLAAFWASPEGEQQMESALLQSSRLVAMLGEIAMRTARSDGWSLLSSAGQLIKREAPAELENLRERFGQLNLKSVLLASQLFDVADEQTSGGGTRTIYRINERYELQIRQDLAVTEQQALVAQQGGLEHCQSD